MWSVAEEALGPGVLNFRVSWGGGQVPVAQAYGLFLASEAFRTALLAELGRAPFAAYSWETPPVTAATADRPFEYVIVDSPALAAARPQVRAFQEKFADDEDGDGIVCFGNLGGDATLVVPCPVVEHGSYTHLAAFVRRAPSAQAQSLLSTLGRTVLRQLGPRPLWVSTAGLGVHWLHVRLDSRPKYYRHAPYAA